MRGGAWSGWVVLLSACATTPPPPAAPPAEVSAPQRREARDSERGRDCGADADCPGGEHCVAWDEWGGTTTRSCEVLCTLPDRTCPPQMQCFGPRMDGVRAAICVEVPAPGVMSQAEPIVCELTPRAVPAPLVAQLVAARARNAPACRADWDCTGDRRCACPDFDRCTVPPFMAWTDASATQSVEANGLCLDETVLGTSGLLRPRRVRPD